MKIVYYNSFQRFVQTAGDAQDKPPTVFLKACIESFKVNGGTIVHGFGLGEGCRFFGGHGFGGTGIDGGKALFNFGGGQFVFRGLTSVFDIRSGIDLDNGDDDLTT